MYYHYPYDDTPPKKLRKIPDDSPEEQYEFLMKLIDTPAMTPLGIQNVKNAKRLLQELTEKYPHLTS